jgi:hypothetical protein
MYGQWPILKWENGENEKLRKAREAVIASLAFSFFFILHHVTIS